jgi:hypothetical protein
MSTNRVTFAVSFTQLDAVDSSNSVWGSIQSSQPVDLPDPPSPSLSIDSHSSDDSVIPPLPQPSARAPQSLLRPVVAQDLDPSFCTPDASVQGIAVNAVERAVSPSGHRITSPTPNPDGVAFSVSSSVVDIVTPDAIQELPRTQVIELADSQGSSQVLGAPLLSTPVIVPPISRHVRLACPAPTSSALLQSAASHGVVMSMVRRRWLAFLLDAVTSFMDS